MPLLENLNKHVNICMIIFISKYKLQRQYFTFITIQTNIEYPSPHIHTFMNNITLVRVITNPMDMLSSPYQPCPSPPNSGLSLGINLTAYDGKSFNLTRFFASCLKSVCQLQICHIIHL